MCRHDSTYHHPQHAGFPVLPYLKSLSNFSLNLEYFTGIKSVLHSADENLYSKQP